jgi:hypothetical protein
MGERKTALSIRVRRSLKDDLQKIADREYRKLGNLGELLMEWSYEQLVAAGSTEALLRGRKYGRMESTTEFGGSATTARGIRGGGGSR